MLQNLWGRPPGLRGTPSSRSPPVESRPCTRRWPTRASAADEGVRPTIYADVRLWENYVAATVRERSTTYAKIKTFMPTQARSASSRQFFGRGGTLSKWHPNYEFRPGQ